MEANISRLPEPQIAILMMRKILDWPERYGPVNGDQSALEQVKFTNSLCLLFRTSQGVPVRSEADFDRVEANEEHGDPGIYQLGATRHYWDNRRNKHLEMVTIDIERYESSLPPGNLRY